ncbi:hypothetical protein [Paractinoplanes hotanensis]|uniref:Uncharacterized protein n=1 Tax=Paractinoplanes hotanensis TaxID=2906497 RepID=A0ABT0Y3K3_9ACTN|nr:hypothetical protein [Actinoplanes hotanensis]MCM4080420.1 hypothetical protein [Actinoplanes hotanensis]
MSERDGGARPAANRPATEPTVAEEHLLRAAARVLARYHNPGWVPTDAELDAWGAGYGLGVRDKLAQDLMNRVHVAGLDCEWPPVTPPGGGA